MSMRLFADIVYRGANVITVDARNPRAQAVAIRDGKFVGVGSDDDIEGLVGTSTRVIDASGLTIVPGLIDAHIHVLSSGIRHVMAADCDQRSIAAIQSELRDRVRGACPGEWIEGFKFDDTKTAERRFLNRGDLDAVSTEFPILVFHRAGHVYYLNSKALELSGYDDRSADPPGGRLGRDPDTGSLDGVLYERAIEPLHGLLPEVTSETRRDGLKTICGMLTASGLTSVHDAMVSNDQLKTYAEGRESGDLAIDSVLNAYERAQSEHPRPDPRHRIEHCTLVDPDLLSRMNRLGAIATPFCTYVYYHGEKMGFYGEERLEWMFAQRSFIDSGVVSTGATDYPPGPFEPLMGIQSCVTRTDMNGKLWGRSQRVGVEEALRLYMLNGAYASFEEDKKGSIEVGKLADLVVLAEDIASVDPFAIKDIPIVETVIGGGTVYEG